MTSNIGTVQFICDQVGIGERFAFRKMFGEYALPYPGAKNFYLLSSELDDPDRLSEALRVTARALPEPRPKTAPSRAKSAAEVQKRKAPN